MIPDHEFRSIARLNGVPISSIERDYAQGWLLHALSGRLEMTLKGGTGVRKVFLEGYRFSDDLDFTLLGEYGLDEIQGELAEAVRAARRGSGIGFLDDVSVGEVSNGFSAAAYFRVLRSSGDPLRVKIDLTGFDREVVLLEPVMRPIIHPYSDALRSDVLSYRLEEVFSEKVRALFERTRPRDLYDVWRLREFSLDVSDIIYRKFRFRDVAFDTDDLTNRKPDFEGAWTSSLEHRLKEVPDFNPVFEEVMECLRILSKLF